MKERDYNSFGMKLENSDYVNSDNKYLYYGKELIEHSGLDCYDYGVRFYDPSLGRWHTQDSLAEKYHSWSPYNYSVNSPILFLDLNGMESKKYTGKDAQYVFAGLKQRFGNSNENDDDGEDAQKSKNNSDDEESAILGDGLIWHSQYDKNLYRKVYALVSKGLFPQFKGHEFQLTMLILQANGLTLDDAKLFNAACMSAGRSLVLGMPSELYLIPSMGDKGEPSGGYTLAKRNFTPLWRLFYNPSQSSFNYRGPYRGGFKGLGYGGNSIPLGSYPQNLGGKNPINRFRNLPSIPHEGAFSTAEYSIWINNNPDFARDTINWYVSFLKSFSK